MILDHTVSTKPVRKCRTYKIEMLSNSGKPGAFCLHHYRGGRPWYQIVAHAGFISFTSPSSTPPASTSATTKATALLLTLIKSATKSTLWPCRWLILPHHIAISHPHHSRHTTSTHHQHHLLHLLWCHIWHSWHSTLSSLRRRTWACRNWHTIISQLRYELLHLIILLLDSVDYIWHLFLFEYVACVCELIEAVVEVVCYV